MLRLVKYEKSFITSGPGVDTECSISSGCALYALVKTILRDVDAIQFGNTKHYPLKLYTELSQLHCS